MKGEVIKAGLAQMAPVLLDREAGMKRILEETDKAIALQCNLLVFGEATLPGYPFWLERSHAAAFNDPRQKALYAHYLEQAVDLQAGHLDALRERCRKSGLQVVIGIVERAPDRGGHSLYCSLVTISGGGEIASVHRKVMPTYEERLVWAIGDGHGLRVHPLGKFKFGSLNCWENWLPLLRSALYAQGEDLHIAVWPGSRRHSEDITRFIAKESRSYVLSVGNLLLRSQVSPQMPHYDEISALCEEKMSDGGSCLAGPDGSWIIEPHCAGEALLTAELSHRKVREERQNLDPAGHYSRPDITRLIVNRSRQSTCEFEGDGAGRENVENN